MTLHFEHHSLNAPTLWVFKDNLASAYEKGVVFFYHGLGSNKDQQKQELVSLAEQGFLTIGIDNVGHGERRFDDFEVRFSSDNPQWGQELLLAVNDTAKEIPELIDICIKKGIQSKKWGVVGVSMGGYIAYAALLNEPRLKAVSVILGSPVFWEAGFESPADTPERFYPTALLSQNAGQDTSVSPHHAREFHEKLVPFYADTPLRQQYIEYPDSGHFMREPDWNECWETNLKWLERFL